MVRLQLEQNLDISTFNVSLLTKPLPSVLALLIKVGSARGLVPVHAKVDVHVDVSGKAGTVLKQRVLLNLTYKVYLLIVCAEMNAFRTLHAAVLVDSPEATIVGFLALHLADGSRVRVTVNDVVLGDRTLAQSHTSA